MFSKDINKYTGIEELTDEELFSRSFVSPSLYSVILDRYQPAFLRKARSVLKDDDLAEDAVQETFIKIYRHAAKFDSRGAGSFKSWAYAVLTNTALTHYQKQKKKMNRTIPLSDELAEMLPDKGEEDQKAGKEAQNYITSVLERMPPNLSRVLSLFFLDGKSQEEIAEEEKLTVGAVKVRVFRAKEAFRQVAGGIIK